MSVGDPVHTCHAECPCHTGGAPREDFTEFGPELSNRAMKSLAHRVTTDIHDSIDMQARLDRYEAALRKIADRAPGDGPSWMRDVARAALGRHGLRAGEYTATHTGPMTAEQLADSLRDG